MQYKLLINQTIAGMMSNNLYDLTEYKINPLMGFDLCEEGLLEPYPYPAINATGKSIESYRDYKNSEKDLLRKFYGLNYYMYQGNDCLLKKKITPPNW